MVLQELGQLSKSARATRYSYRRIAESPLSVGGLHTNNNAPGVPLTDVRTGAIGLPGLMAADTSIDAVSVSML